MGRPAARESFPEDLEGEAAHGSPPGSEEFGPFIMFWAPLVGAPLFGKNKSEPYILRIDILGVYNMILILACEAIYR